MASLRTAVAVAVGVAILLWQATEISTVIAQVIRRVGASWPARHESFRAVNRF